MPTALQTTEFQPAPAGATAPAMAHLYEASGHEAAARSPALELQEALEVMLVAPRQRTVRPAAALALTLGVTGVAGVCTLFWLSLARMLMSAV